MKLDDFRKAWEKLNTGVPLATLREAVLTPGNIDLAFLDGDERSMDVSYRGSSEFCKALGLNPDEIHRIEMAPGHMDVTRVIMFEK